MIDPKTIQAMAVRQSLGLERLGDIMWKSGYWQDTRSQAQAIVKILAGSELNFGPIASMNGVFIIEGKTTLAANLVGAAIQGSQRYRYRVVEHDEKHCIIDFYEIVGNTREKLGTSKFDEADAKAAGLLDKKGGMWTKYPRNMYFSRALTNGARWYTPDVFSGPIYTPDELGAELDEGGNVIDVTPYTPMREQDPEDTSPNRTISLEDDRLWLRWLDVRTEALKVGLVPPSLSLPIAYKQLVSNAQMLKAQTGDKLEKLAAEEAARTEAQSSEPDGPWDRNRELQAKVYAAGHRVRDLPNDATDQQVEEQNRVLEAWLEARKAPVVVEAQ